jgi:hypothetical protein
MDFTTKSRRREGKNEFPVSRVWFSAGAAMAFLKT